MYTGECKLFSVNWLLPGGFSDGRGNKGGLLFCTEAHKTIFGRNFSAIFGIFLLLSFDGEQSAMSPLAVPGH